MLVREEVVFAAHVGHLQESQALSSERLGSPALYFPVQSDPLERGYRLCARACLITADLYTTIGMVSVALVGISLCLVVAQVYRYRHISSAIQRQQTKWVSFGVIGGLVINSLGIVSLWFLSSLHFATTTHAFFFTPVTTFLVLLGPVYVGMAITRSHLWSIDLIIRRTLIYGLLTASLLGLYLLLVFGSQYLLASFFGSSNDVVLVVSTLIVAALFEPLRQRVQQMVDRRFYRSKYDATQILADFSETLHQEVDLDQLCVQLLAAVQQTMQPTSLSLWLRPRNPQEKLEQPGKKLPPA